MRLEDCHLDVEQAVSAPLRRAQPEPDWMAARDSGVLPAPLFQLYEQAQYLSFGAAPPFLADGENILLTKTPTPDDPTPPQKTDTEENQ